MHTHRLPELLFFSSVNLTNDFIIANLVWLKFDRKHSWNWTSSFQIVYYFPFYFFLQHIFAQKWHINNKNANLNLSGCFSWNLTDLLSAVIFESIFKNHNINKMEKKKLVLNLKICRCDSETTEEDKSRWK